ncbi:MAG: hypothetical protein ACFWTN_07515 [Clostridium sp.]
MIDPCLRCPCKQHKRTCRKFCKKYKLAVKRDTKIGMVQMGLYLHEKIRRGVRT